MTNVAPVKVAGLGDAADELVGETASIFGYGLTAPSFTSQPKHLQTDT